MSDQPYLTAQFDHLDKIAQEIEHLKSIARSPNGDADDYDYAYANFYSTLSDFTEFSISTPGFTGLTDLKPETFLRNLCDRAADVFRAPHACLCLGGTSQSMLMLIGKILPQSIRDPKRTIILADMQCHQSVLGGIDIGHWDIIKLPRHYKSKFGLARH